MFYYKTDLVRLIQVHPKYIGGKHDIKEVVRKLTKQDAKENSFTPEAGYIIDVVCISDIGKGHCVPVLGHVEFPVTFEAILLFPIIGEVIFAEVVSVTKEGIKFCHVCVHGIVKISGLDSEYEYKEIAAAQDNIKGGSTTLTMGVFSSVFNKGKDIKVGSNIRVRIIKKTLMGRSDLLLIGTLRGDMLGPVAVTGKPAAANNSGILFEPVMDNVTSLEKPTPNSCVSGYSKSDNLSIGAGSSTSFHDKDNDLEF